jgi:hypothetical protein
MAVGGPRAATVGGGDWVALARDRLKSGAASSGRWPKAMAALDDRPRPGREPKITLEAKAWLTSLSCRKAKDLGYPHELGHYVRLASKYWRMLFAFGICLGLCLFLG